MQDLAFGLTGIRFPPLKIWRQLKGLNFADKCSFT